jgi:hypothetical protein
MKWRAFYADGSRFSSAEMHWQALPATGLVGVVIYLEPPYRRIIDGHDWVWMEGVELHAVTTHAEWGRWAPKPVACGSCVKQGAAMDDDAFAAVQAEMLAARTVP